MCGRGQGTLRIPCENGFDYRWLREAGRREPLRAVWERRWLDCTSGSASG